MLTEERTNPEEKNDYVHGSNSKQEKEELIVCDSLVKIFKTSEIEVMALQGLDLTIYKGDLLSVIGKSGSGKSTLMNIIGGLETPTAGKITFAGKNMAEFTEKELVAYRKKNVGFVWQNSTRNLYPYLTSLENVMMAMSFSGMSNKAKKERALMLLEQVGILKRKDSYPRQMSGGEQQRVAIAVALANNPAVLLADEPTGAVDSKTSDAIQLLFRQLNRELGITIIIVTHDMKLADRTDRVLMIADGKISTEKIMKEKYREKLGETSSFAKDGTGDFESVFGDQEEAHEEYSVLDKANRVQLTPSMLEAAGIRSKKVRVSVEDGQIVIKGE